MALVLTTSRPFIKYPAAKKIIENAGHQIKIMTPSVSYKADDLKNLISSIDTGVDAIIAGLDEITSDVINAANGKLKIIARNGVGYDNVAMETANKNNIVVTNTPNGNNVSVAEFAFAMIIGLSRQIHKMDQQVRDGKWQRIMGIELHNKTVGILGTGAIGRELAKRCRAFGMNVIAYSQSINKELVEQYQVEYVTDVNTLFESADYISLHLPSTPETQNIINHDSLKIIKKGAFVINTARGELVDEDALYDALINGHLGGAGLDTFKTEPLTEHRFLNLDNVIVTPHAAGFTDEATERTLMMAAQDVVRVLAGQPALHQVNK